MLADFIIKPTFGPANMQAFFLAKNIRPLRMRPYGCSGFAWFGGGSLGPLLLHAGCLLIRVFF